MQNANNIGSLLKNHKQVCTFADDIALMTRRYKNKKEIHMKIQRVWKCEFKSEWK